MINDLSIRVRQSWPCNLRVFIRALTLGLALFGFAQVGVSQERNPAESTAQSRLFWVFLTAGKSTEGVPRERLEEMQAEHLANFRRLAQEGKLLTAGPISDPENVRRGIVVLKSDRQEDLKKWFQDDPFISEGYLRLEPCQMEFELGKLQIEKSPSGMEEYRIVVLEDNPASATDQAGQLEQQSDEYLQTMFDDRQLNLSVRLFNRRSGCKRVLILPKSRSEETTAKFVGEIPAVRGGIWRQRTMPIFMGRGVIRRARN